MIRSYLLFIILLTGIPGTAAAKLHKFNTPEVNAKINNPDSIDLSKFKVVYSWSCVRSNFLVAATSPNSFVDCPDDKSGKQSVQVSSDGSFRLDKVKLKYYSPVARWARWYVNIRILKGEMKIPLVSDALRFDTDSLKDAGLDLSMLFKNRLTNLTVYKINRTEVPFSFSVTPNDGKSRSFHNWNKPENKDKGSSYLTLRLKVKAPRTEDLTNTVSTSAYGNGYIFYSGFKDNDSPELTVNDDDKSISFDEAYFLVPSVGGKAVSKKDITIQGELKVHTSFRHNSPKNEFHLESINETREVSKEVQFTGDIPKKLLDDLNFKIISKFKF